MPNQTAQWTQMSPADTLKEMKTSEQGLSVSEVEKRQKKYGLNEIQAIEKNSWWKLLISQFLNIMVLILIGAVIISLLAHEVIDAIAIGVIVLINAVIGFIQEYRAEKAIEALKKMASPKAIVIRDKKTLEIDAKELVPGDIILLEEGAQIPADARLLNSAQLKTNEASLTGESQAILKQCKAIKKASTLGDQTNRVFLGTLISQGHGMAVVTETGMKTEFGKIAHMVQTADGGKTPLQVQLDILSKWLAVLVVGIAALMFTLAYLTGRDLIEMLLLSISLAVSVIPEGLPAVITLSLAIGVQRIAKNNAIIRKLPAAESLGSTSVICTDKTGTLTKNEMTVQTLYLNGERIDVDGSGYKPKGKIHSQQTKELAELLKAAALCNNARLYQSKKEWLITGDPTEACLLTLTVKGGYDLQKLNKQFPRKDELIFDSARKRMSTLNKNIQYTKGAPTGILKICTHILEDGERKRLTEAKRKSILKENDKMASSAFRVLAFAMKKHSKGDLKESGMTFIGLAGMIDPPRPEVKQAIATCRSAHIEVIMITGDHALTAKAIGESIGLYTKGDKVITGEELEQMNDTQLKKEVEHIRIFARVNPEHKVRILTALQERNHIVAMTGDGVNDAPALKKADIGVAMGITGTDVAKEASEMILTDDNFATIVSTIENGRNIYRNLKKFIRFSLSSNFDEVILITVTFLIAGPIPFLPLQILWINLLTDSFPGLALGNDSPDEGIMKLKPRDPKRSIWQELIQFSAVASIISASAAIVLYFHFQKIGGVEHMQTAMFTFVIMVELLIAFSVRFGHKHFFTHFFSNAYLWLACIGAFTLQLLAIYSPWMQNLLGTVALDWNDWLWILGACLVAIVSLEIWKSFQKELDHV